LLGNRRNQLIHNSCFRAEDVALFLTFVTSVPALTEDLFFLRTNDTTETLMNTLFTLRGLGHRGRQLAHQLSLERPPRPPHKLPGIELVVVDLDDPRIQIELLANSTRIEAHIQSRIALVLIPNECDLGNPPSPLRTVREYFDAWIPILPYEVVNPNQEFELGFRQGYMPSVRMIFWRLTRMVQHQGMVQFMESDFEEFWKDGTTLWSFQVTASGENRAEIAAQLLDAAATEPIFWNAYSNRWMMQICSSSLPEYQITNEEIVAVTEPFSHEPYNLTGIRWATSVDDDLEDRIIIDVLAIGEPLGLNAQLDILSNLHRLS
jgi:hypothetical protein